MRSGRGAGHPNGVVSTARRLLVLLALGLLGACSSQVMGPSQMVPVAPALSVERFLQAANVRDLEEMSRIFGTSSGPIGDTGSSFGCAFKKMGSWIGIGSRCVTRQEIEVRLDAIARILSHDDYVVRGESRVAGRAEPTTQVDVDLTIGSRVVSGVPFLVVRAGDGRWMVQEIHLQEVTR